MADRTFVKELLGDGHQLEFLYHKVLVEVCPSDFLKDSSESSAEHVARPAGEGMRREVGAIILVVLCLLFKLPELTGDSGRSPRVWGGTEVAPRSLPESRAPRLSGPDAIPRIPAEFYSNALIFLSTAPPDSLALLPGIGPVLAERIACAANARNPFTRWEDLLSVKGIGPKKLEVLKRTAVRR